jgi:hypothetical protein
MLKEIDFRLQIDLMGRRQDQAASN